jgi:hypothetical protein
MTTASPSSPRGSASKKHSLAGSRAVLFILNMAAALQCGTATPPGTLTLRIAVDQFGYLPDMTKMAVISDPQVGFNAAASYTPGGMLQVRAWGSNTVVLSGSPSGRISGGTEIPHRRFLHQLGATNLTYILQGSPDLITWSDLCTAAGTNAPSGPGFISESGTGYQRQIVACDTVRSESSATARFVRFKLVWH